MGRTLVTGSSGFIGSRLVKRLDSSDVITDSDNSSRIDLADRNQVLRLGSADTVIHLGGRTPKNGIPWSEYFENNVSATLNILEYCKKNKSRNLIYASSYVYGKPNSCPIDESHQVRPHNAYTESKYIGERLCRFYCDRTDLSVTILRPFNIFGKSMRDGYLISNLVSSAKTGKETTITNKDSKRDFLYVDDFVDLLLRIKDHDSKFEIFNVGSGQSHSFAEVAEKIQDIAGEKLSIRYEQDMESYIPDIRADISKIKGATGWQPKVKFEDGLRQVFDSF